MHAVLIIRLLVYIPGEVPGRTRDNPGNPGGADYNRYLSNQGLPHDEMAHHRTELAQ